MSSRSRVGGEGRTIRSRKQEAGAGAGSRKQEAGSRKQEAGSREIFYPSLAVGFAKNSEAANNEPVTIDTLGRHFHNVPFTLRPVSSLLHNRPSIVESIQETEQLI
jgi:hypothetical protein